MVESEGEQHMSPASHTGSALVADDTMVARVAIVRRLRASGVACTEAGSAAEASAVNPSSLTCALLDLDLGDGTGVDVANALRVKKPTLPVAFFSAGAPVDLLTRARAMGPVFAKPQEADQAVAWVLSHAQP